jgi:hypothetical protein
MSPVLLNRALEGTAAFLERRGGADALVARAVIGRPHDDDEAEATRLVRALLDGQSRDGSFDGDLGHTAGVLVQIREVSEAAGLGEVDPGVGRGLDWLRGRQGQPGRWSDGCSPDRHGAGLCHHFVGGFFAPAPPDMKLPAMDVSCGVTLERDGDIRFVASCLALRTFWRWQAHAPDATLHLDGVRAALVSPSVARLSPEAVLEGLITVLDAPQQTEQVRETIAQHLDDLAARQLGDGSWGNVDVFHALDVLLHSDELGVATVAAEHALGRSAHLLASAQQPDGSWGSQAADRRALLGWRAMRWAADREAGNR